MNEYYKKDLYKILGVEPDCDVAKIKSAYRKQARKWHPDVNDNSEESIVRFKEITEAYEVLTDAQKRSQYDILKGFNTSKSTTNSRSNTSSSYYSKSQEKSAQKAYTESSKYSDNNKNRSTREFESKGYSNYENTNKSSFSQVFENILDGLFTSSGSSKKTGSVKAKNQKSKPIKGADINLNVTIKMAESITGTTRTVNVLHTERCPKCEGRRFINGSKCSMCRGAGEISSHKKLNVKIPSGIKNGAKIRISDEGNKGYNGGKNGDLFLLVSIEENDFYRYEGINVYCEIPITPYEAALGATIDVPTLCGNVSMKIPPNTTTGQKFRLSQQGVYDAKNKIRGDQIIVVKIEMPKKLSDLEIKLYEQLKNISNHKVRENLLNDNRD